VQALRKLVAGAVGDDIEFCVESIRETVL
jgi:hypothetical protein